jgi:glutaminyl-tRNA synthetase
MSEVGNFIYTIIENEISDGGRCYGRSVHTRFPPEPNGYLHIGHAKAICIDFLSAKKYNGLCNLRMDDTNPSKEDVEYVESIKRDIKWLGFDWEDRFYYASDYFEQMYQNAIKLIEKGLAYVCDLTAEETKKYRGDLQTPATSPYRNRPIEESLDLFKRMRNGEFPDGSRTLRAKIDLSSGNFNMRDPVIYRIMHKSHHRTGNQWPIYPMYDYAHPIEDAIEGITHSLCSLEFEDHRPLYDWVVNNMDIDHKPRQIEFARLNLDHTVMSKRKLKLLVDEKIVDGWDDPRMPTLSGLRRRGFTPESIRDFCSKIGVSKSVSTVEYAFLENCLRDDLNLRANRIMAVIDPVKLIIENYPDGKNEVFEIENNPKDESTGTRQISFGKELFIERSDFMKEKVPKFFRLYPGSSVRLKSAYTVTCTGFEEDENGNISLIKCKYYPESAGGKNIDGVKVKSTIHWVSANDCATVQVNDYESLFTSANPEEDGDFLSKINPNSLKIMKNCKIENCISKCNPGDHFQFLRNGYFCVDPSTNENGMLIFNKSVSLKSSFGK